MLSLSKHVADFVMRKTLRLRQHVCGSALRQAQGERNYLLISELTKAIKAQREWISSVLTLRLKPPECAAVSWKNQSNSLLPAIALRRSQARPAGWVERPLS